MPSLNKPQLLSRPKTFYIFFFSFFTILRFFPLEIDIFGLKTFQKVYTENNKDIYGDRKLDHVKNVKDFDLKRV